MRFGHAAALCLLALWSAACAGTGTLVEDTVPGASIEGNLLGDSHVRPVTVYLPPAYAREPDSRFPVLYLLHGYTATHTFWREFGDARPMLAGNGDNGGVIVVMPDARNRYFGSFYTNSPTTGRWEDFVTTDLVAYVDQKYRTIPRADSRGLAGHSMGGYGAIRIGMRRPDVFGAVYAMSPCCIDLHHSLLDANVVERLLALRTPTDLDRVLADISVGRGQGLDGFLVLANVALAAAWSPNVAKPPFFVDLLASKTNGTITTVETTRAKWLAHMPLYTVDTYRENLARLRGFAFDAGTRDEFAEIPASARAFSAALRERGIQHRFDEYDGTHFDRIAERVRTQVLPFFARTLSATP